MDSIPAQAIRRIASAVNPFIPDSGTLSKKPSVSLKTNEMHIRLEAACPDQAGHGRFIIDEPQDIRCKE